MRHPSRGEAQDAALNALAILFYLPVALGSVVFLSWTGGEYGLVVRTVGETPGRDAAIGLAAGLAIVIASRFAARLPTGRAMVVAFQRALGRPTVLSCLALACSAAIAEELLFRAVLQPRLGVWITTLLFAAAHFPFDRALAWWPLVAVPTGLVFGGLYEWTGAALASIVAHGVVNGLNLLWITRARGRRSGPA